MKERLLIAGLIALATLCEILDVFSKYIDDRTGAAS